MSDDGGDPAHRAATALGAGLAAALVIAVVLIGGMFVGFKMLGLGGSPSADPSGPASLYMPSGSSSGSGGPDTGPVMRPDVPTQSGAASAGTSPSDGVSDPEALTFPDDQDSTKPARNSSAHKGRHARALSLAADPRSVGVYERINLTGAWAGHDGVSLRVQRFESGWTDFPTDATVRGGRYATYVETGISGVNRFRMVDPSTGQASNAVTVEVHG